MKEEAAKSNNGEGRLSHNVVVLLNRLFDIESSDRGKLLNGLLDVQGLDDGAGRLENVKDRRLGKATQLKAGQASGLLWNIARDGGENWKLGCWLTFELSQEKRGV